MSRHRRIQLPVKAVGSFDPAEGSMSFSLTTEAEPLAPGPGESTEALVVFANREGACSWLRIADVLEGSVSSGPVAVIESLYGEPTFNLKLVHRNPTLEIEGTKASSGTTTTFAQRWSPLVEGEFNCVGLRLREDSTSTYATSFVAFKLAPAPAAPPAPAPPAPSPPPPAPAALSIAGLRPLSLEPGTWQTVKVKVTNDGGTATSPGTLRVKAPSGVLVKPDKQALPVLLPGGSFTRPIRVELTKNAKQKSTVYLSAGASGAAGGSGSIALKLKR